MNGSDQSQRQFAARGRLVLIVIGAMLLIQAIRSVLGPDADANLVLTFAFVPASIAWRLDPAGAASAAARLIDQDTASMSDIALLVGTDGLRWWTPLTYALLHGGWTHVIVNSVWLAAFGSAVARRFGAVRFLLFFAATAIGGAVAHCTVHFFDFAPLVGASAAISGAMAAAARFAFVPGAPLGPGARRGTLQAYQGAPLSLRDLPRDGRAMAFLVAWFAANLLFGAFATPMGVSDASIAWEAHIGGFLTGLLLFRFFDPVDVAPAAAAEPDPVLPRSDPVPPVA